MDILCVLTERDAPGRPAVLFQQQGAERDSVVWTVVGVSERGGAGGRGC